MSVLPPFFIGPYAPGLIIQPGSLQSLSTSALIYNLLLPDSKSQTSPFGYVDVRDVAAALIAGIKTQGKNRILISGEWFEHKDAVDYIASVRPELKDRLPTNLVPTGQTKGVVDNSRAVEVLVIPRVRAWEESVVDAVDAILTVEKDWIAKAVDLQKTLMANMWRST